MYIFDASNNQTNTKMNEVTTLIRKAFNAEGYLVSPKSRKNQQAAKSALESGVDYSKQTLDGYNVHASLLIIAYPTQSI